MSAKPAGVWGGVCGPPAITRAIGTSARPDLNSCRRQPVTDGAARQAELTLKVRLGCTGEVLGDERSRVHITTPSGIPFSVHAAAFGASVRNFNAFSAWSAVSVEYTALAAASVAGLSSGADTPDAASISFCSSHETPFAFTAARM